LAPIFTFATVLGAIVGIVADVAVLPFKQLGFVQFAVTVIIESVANFLLRRQGIAVREPLFGAYPLPFTGTKFAFAGARGPQRKGYRIFSAGA